MRGERGREREISLGVRGRCGGVRRGAGGAGGGVRRGAMGGGGAGGGVRAWGVAVFFSFFGTAGLAMDGSAVA